MELDIMATKIKTEVEQLTEKFLPVILKHYQDTPDTRLEAVFLGDHPQEGYSFVAKLQPVRTPFGALPRGFNKTKHIQWLIHREACYPTLTELNQEYFYQAVITKVYEQKN